jgi:tetratricopeptide (TPR) repeat protein
VRRALDLARQHAWWEEEIAISQALLLFLQMGQQNEAFNRLAGEMVSVVMDLQTRELRPGRERHFPTIMENLATMAENRRDLDSAEALFGYAIDHNRPRLAERMRRPDYDAAQSRALVSELAFEVYRRGQVRFGRNDAQCLGDFQEAIELYQHIGFPSVAANPALDAGTACLRLPSLRDLDAAEQWFLRADKWCDQRDNVLRAKCCIQLAGLAQERVDAAQSQPAALPALLQAANLYALRALSVLPEMSVRERAVCHARLGTNLRTMGELAPALEHSQGLHATFRSMRRRILGRSDTPEHRQHRYRTGTIWAGGRIRARGLTAIQGARKRSGRAGCRRRAASRLDRRKVARARDEPKERRLSISSFGPHDHGPHLA